MSSNTISWRTSSYSGANGQCVEVATTGKSVVIRDTNARDQAILVCPPIQWRTLVLQIKRGELP
jgi:hypothetical protein